MKTLKNIGLVSLILFLVICIMHAVILPTTPVKNKCGIVLTHSVKHVSNNNTFDTLFMLNVDFGDKYYKEINVSAEDYMKIKNGESICYDFPVKASFMYHVLHIIGFIGIMLLVILTIGLMYARYF